MERLLAAAPKVPAAIASGFTAAGKARHPPGPAAVEIWPVEVQALAHRLSGVGIPALRLPIFGPWLFKDVTPSLQLAGVLSTRAFRALATRTIRTVGGDAFNCGTHSLRRAAAALFHAGVPHPLITQALRPPRHGRTSHRHVSFITIGKKAGFLRGGSDHGRIQNFRRTSGNIFFDHFWTSHTPLNQLSVPRWPPHRACRAVHAAARRARWCCHYACGSGPTEYPPPPRGGWGYSLPPPPLIPSPLALIPAAVTALCGGAARTPFLRHPRAPRYRHRSDAAPSSALSGKAHSHSGSLLPLYPVSPYLSRGFSASRPARLHKILALAHVHVRPYPAPILQSPIRRSSHAAARPAAIQRRGRSPIIGSRSAGRFRQLRSGRIRSSVVNGGGRPE